jgi:hypothetical protein
VIDRLDRRRHNAIVGGDHKDHDIGRLGSARTHGGEGFVARRIDERNLLAVLFNLIGANMLGDATGLALYDIGVADRIEQRCLTVIDVTHNGHDRWTRRHR